MADRRSSSRVSSQALTTLVALLLYLCSWTSEQSRLWVRAQAENETATDNNDTVEEEEEDRLSVLGEPVWTRLRPGWSLTVNDQCLYEFTFQFEHDPTLPVGEAQFEGVCGFDEDSGGETSVAPDGKLWLEARQMWERFPDYVWATMGFNHLSVDWHPCGIRPRGYSEPQYAFSVSEKRRNHQHLTCGTES